MKTKRIFYAATLIGCLTTAVTAGILVSFAPKWSHRAWLCSVADTKTFVAAVRYLVEPDLRYFPQHPERREFTALPTELLLTSATNQSSTHNSNQTTSVSHAMPVSG